jgi:uncharacterized protein YciI
MKTQLLACSLVLCLLAAPVMAADTPPATSLFVILYKQGPAWKGGVPMQKQDAIGAHYKYMKQLFEQGVILDAGPTTDEPGGLVILKVADLSSATAAMDADPSITLKMFVGEVHAWSPSFRSPDPLPMAALPGTVTRSLKENIVTSSADPAVQIEMPASASFVGGDTWVLQAYLDSITFYAFVDADSARNVQRLYWVQFEAYLPSHPEYHHTYDSNRHVNLGGLDFLVDTWAATSRSKDEPDSDSAHLHGDLVRQGYALPASMMTVRFVHLMDGARKELMYIYSEATPDGLTADDLKQGGKAYDKWPELEKGLIERGEKSIQFH